MLSGLEKLKTRRAWLVPDFSIWGLPALGETEFLLVENVDNNRGVFFNIVNLTDTVQEVAFNQLTDHRGNQLPAEISAPLVIPRSKSDVPVFVVGTESDSQFKIARAAGDEKPVTADLLVMEMGN
ncbi:MAG: hypothetical protein JXA92_02480 [candidate division Zixibacteria bacterium]|nr:hypothetical protein [candidate division Zixibacteria bacterium]